MTIIKKFVTIDASTVPENSLFSNNGQIIIIWMNFSSIENLQTNGG